MNKLIALTASRRAAMAIAGIAALTTLSVNAQTAPVNGAAVNDAQVPTHVVGYEDLDLSERADTQALYRRLQLAAEDVCNVYAAPRTTVLNKVDARCKREAVAKAVAAIGHPNLTALHVERGGMKLARIKSDTATKSAAAKSVAVPASSGG